MHNLKRTIITAKYLKPKQVIYRIKYILIKKLKKKVTFKNSKRDYNNILYFLKNEELFVSFKDAIKNDYINKSKCDKILDNEFTFLNNLTYRFSHKIEWRANPFDYRLWSFHLNYFDYLFDLMWGYIFYDNTEYILKGYKLIYSWVDTNIGRYNPDLWDPYVTSKRVVNWIIFYSQYKQFCSDPCKVLHAIETHASFLRKNIEYYLGANHVMMDAKALVFCGVFLNDKMILNKGLKILNKEFKEQVLGDGGHYENSTSYHVEVLMHYLEVGILLKRNGYEEKGQLWIQEIRFMFEYLYHMMMPNGEIPLVNDSTLDYPLKANELLECGVLLYGDPKFKKYSGEALGLYGIGLFGIEGYKKFSDINSSSMVMENVINKNTGYYIIKDCIKGEDLFLLFDCGNGGPDYNLGHTHADALNIILTLGNDKLFVDSGVFTYKHCDERDYFRSTEAHNTICIDGISSSQIWKAFRIAQRAKTSIIKYSDNRDYTLIAAKHDGYTKVLKEEKIVHQRCILYIKTGFLVIADSLYGNFKRGHFASLNYYTEGLINRIDNNALEVNKRLRISFNYPFQIEEVKVSNYFSVLKEASRIKVVREFDNPICFLTFIKFDLSDMETINIQDEVICIKGSNREIRLNLKDLSVLLKI